MIDSSAWLDYFNCSLKSNERKIKPSFMLADTVIFLVVKENDSILLIMNKDFAGMGKVVII